MKNKIICGFVCLILFSISSATISADTINDNGDELSNIIFEIMEVTTAPQHIIETSIEEIAIENNLDKITVAKEILADIYEESNNNEVLDAVSTRISTTLPVSSFGDIWYSKATTSFYNHGHVGLYYDSTQIIEARGAGYKVAVRSIYAITAKAGDSVMMVTTTNGGSTRRGHSQRLSAVEWAELRIGSNYAYTVNNKSCGVNDYNCSQLVWCSYNNAVGVDLDSDGTWLVTPMDIKNSGWTKAVWSQ